MAPQMDPATPIKLSSIRNGGDALLGRKFRIAGRSLSYDPETQLILLGDRDALVLVDVSLCADPYKGSSWIREDKSIIMAIGYLERSPTPFPIPYVPSHTMIPRVSVDATLVLRAIIVIEASDLDLGLWNTAIDERNSYEVAGEL
ncbi:hypothetical protein JAAARDRAFT_194034 [Jaapia argillacea MUCL 33604]|uniref:Uncharacterized protein n=1 Tax=Jaapia argillacea MUCL 33604 TaxID=933084 RepID=A0A067Q2N2_9AGAM|nr:hypothetical protein JAAARDRAFT_194034 [Jaapia argillacea MUCL 33604]